MLAVIVKHAGKRYNVDLDPESNGETFKFQLYSLTGVEPERQKILVKGGQLKDDTDMSKLGIKAGHSFMMMGQPSPEALAALQAPKEKVKFLEDMTEAEAAQIEGATPAGLQNLGNTCYMNSTLQVLKSIPELQETLAKYTSRYAHPDLMIHCQMLTHVVPPHRVDRVTLASLVLQVLERQWILQLPCVIFLSKCQKRKKAFRP
jgi:hypothetical protein